MMTTTDRQQPVPTYGVVLFPSVSHALRAESLVRAAGVPCKLIPTPRQLSSDCGSALRIVWEDRQTVLAELEKAGLEFEAIHPLK